MTKGIAPEGKVCLVHIFPLLAYAKPLQLPLIETLLVPPKNRVSHPDPEKLHLYARHMSRVASDREAFS